MQEIDLESTIYSQYDKSPKLRALIETFKLISPIKGIEDIFNKIYNLNTANSYGLDIWGYILNFGRTVELTGDEYFGFKSANYEPFNQAPFFNGKQTGYYKLPDEPYRKLLKIISMRNTTSATLPELNKITQMLFGTRGVCKVERTSTMLITFTFNFIPEQWEIALLKNTAIMPIPACCDYEIINNII